MVNDMYSNTYVGLNHCKYLTDILKYEWDDFLYNVGQNVNNEPVIIKTILINNINKSNEYIIKLSAHPSLLLLFGKSVGSIINTEGNKMIMGKNPFIEKQTQLTSKTYFLYILIVFSIIISYLTKQYYSAILTISLFYYFAIYKYIQSSNFNIQKITACGGSLTGMKMPLPNLETMFEINPNEVWHSKIQIVNDRFKGDSESYTQQKSRELDKYREKGWSID
jgi:hypothetical protein